MHQTELSSDHLNRFTSYDLQNTKGGLLVQISNDKLEGELTYYNVTQFTQNRMDDKPAYRDVESKLVRKGSAVVKDSTSNPAQRKSKISESSFGTNVSLVVVRSQ